MDYTTPTTIDIGEVNRALDILVDRQHYVMVQSLNPANHYHSYGNGRDFILAIVNQFASKNPGGIYTTLNPVREGVSGSVKNDDIVARRFFFVDIDRAKTEEPTACATQHEREQVFALATGVSAYLHSFGWPRPIMFDSGNGCHLLWPVCVPNDDATLSLFRNALRSIQTRFGDQIDSCVYDARRIIRLPGTQNAKGTATPDRPHRIARVLKVPSQEQLLAPSLIQAVIDANPVANEEDATQALATASIPNDTEDLRPGTDFNFRADWRDILQPHGWSICKKTSEKTEWTRSGKDDGCSATTGYCESDKSGELLYVFSSNAEPFEASKSYSKFAAYALLNHKGDFRKAAADLSRQDYGHQPEPVNSNDVREDVDDPDRLARVFLDGHYRSPAGELTLRYWRQDWWRWNGSIYRRVDQNTIEAEVHRAIKAEYDRVYLVAQAASPHPEATPAALKVTRNLVQNVHAAIKATIIIDENVQPQSWLVETSDNRDILTMNNGLLRYGSLLDAVPPVLLPHSPSWFSATKFPYNFDPKAQCPNWLRFLHQNLEGDAERIALMQEWFGYSLIPDTRQQKFMVLDGEGANGKSVVCAAYTAMLGMDNCAFVPLESFGERFQLTQTLGKLANIAPECGEIDRVAEGVLKSFTSGDSMFFDRKHKSPIQARPTARFMLATNNRPRFSDRSSGLWRRMIIVPFHVTIQQADRILGMDKAEYWQDELPGILNWALEGLRRLRMEGQFTRPRVCEEAIAAYRLDCNPAAEFLNENYRADATQSVVCQELYKHYQAWCLEHGYQPLGDNKFGVEVGRAFSQVQRKRTGSVDRKYVYMGVGRASVAGWQQAPLPFRKAN